MGTGYLMPRASLLSATTDRRARFHGASADAGILADYGSTLSARRGRRRGDRWSPEKSGNL